jgi:hypothetical protein
VSVVSGEVEGVVVSVADNVGVVESMGVSVSVLTGVSVNMSVGVSVTVAVSWAKQRLLRTPPQIDKNKRPPSARFVHEERMGKSGEYEFLK